MKPIHVVATIVRLFAICLLVYASNQFVNTAMLIAVNEIPLITIFGAMVLAILLILSIVLWYFPVSISRKLTSIPPQSDDEKLQFNQLEFLSICIFSLGLYFLYNLIGDAVYWYTYLNDPAVRDTHTNLVIGDKASLWGLGFRAIFVLLLLTGNRLIVKLYKALRYGG